MKDSSGVNYLDMLWHCSQLSYTEEKTYSNKDISSCKHIREIFKDTRVGVEKQDSEFINEACRKVREQPSGSLHWQVAPGQIISRKLLHP